MMIHHDTSNININKYQHNICIIPVQDMMPLQNPGICENIDNLYYYYIN